MDTGNIMENQLQDMYDGWDNEQKKKFESGENCGCQSSKGFNPDLPDDCRKCPNKRGEWIICPDCSMNQEANVIPTIPFETRIHECEQCGYIITESEWLIDSD